MKTQLFKKIIVSGEIELISGLHIGGNKDNVEIGGIDRIVIRNKIDRRPYIPGSSLKGKIRSLLEIATGSNGKSDFQKSSYTTSEGQLVAEVFGNAGDGTKNDTGDQSRIIFRDCNLTILSQQKLFDSEFTDTDYTEIKTETAIDRIKGMAKDKSLRQFERVPAGASFDFSFVINIIAQNEDEAINKEQLYLNLIKAGLTLLEDDYLGGCGSRGYGQIKVNIDWDNIEHKAVEAYFKH